MNPKIYFFALWLIGTHLGFAKCEISFQVYVDSTSFDVYFDVQQSSWQGSTYAYWDFGDGTQDSIEYEEATHYHEMMHQFPNYGRYIVSFEIECEGASEKRYYNLWLTKDNDPIPKCEGEYDYTIASSPNDDELHQLQLSLKQPFEGSVNWWKGYWHQQGNPAFFDIRYPEDCPLLLSAANSENYIFCRDTLNLDFEVDFKANFEIIPQFRHLRFRNTSWGNMHINSWDFGNGVIRDSTIHANYGYPQTGEYEVCLFSTEPLLNQKDTICQMVEIKCRDSFSYEIDEDYSNVVNFYIPSTGMEHQVYFDFGDGTTTELNSGRFSHVYDNTQQFITACFWELGAECADTICQTLDFLQPTFCEAKYRARPIGKGTHFLFEDYSVYQADKADSEWVRGYSFEIGEGSPFVYAIDSEGNRQITLRSTAEDGCYATYQENIYFKKIKDNNRFVPAPCFTIEPTSNSLSYHFNNHTPDAASYVWDFGDETISTLLQPEHSYTQSGFYEVCLTASKEDTLQNKMMSETFCDWLNIGEIDTCAAKFIAIPEIGDYTLEMDGEIKFYNLSYLQSDATWFWDFGDGTTSTEFEPHHLFTYSDTFKICLTVSKPQGCVQQYCEDIFYGCELQLEGEYLKESDQLLIEYQSRSHIDEDRIEWRINNHFVGSTKQMQGTFLVNEYSEHDDFDFVFDTVEVCAHYNWVTDCHVLCQKIVVDSTTTSIESFEKKASIRVFPNPFSDFTAIEIEGLSQDNYQLEVMDILGRKLKELDLENGKAILERGKLESGLYLIRVLEKENGKILGSEKVLVE
ncbi:MAG: PKD domain-containing protein [Chitinophagales bacterium]